MTAQLNSSTFATRFGCCIAVALVVATNARAETQFATDRETGLATWVTENAGFAVRLTQLGPDQTYSFFEARGFSSDDARRYADTCVFMSVVRNVGAQPLDFDLRQWRYQPRGAAIRPMKVKEHWLEEWQARGLPEAAIIAFAWSQLPTEQTFAPGDWNQGMTTFSLPRGESFDLHYQWQSGDNTHAGKLEGASCAPASDSP
ncbi:MAG: hypothetical protein ACFCUJ_07085 [Thiotrichales bacterium]